MSLYTNLISVARPVFKVYHRLEVHGLENVPPEGCGFVLVANHQHWFGWDGVALGAALEGRPVRWLSWSYEKEFPLWDRLVRALDGVLYNQDTPFPYEELAGELRTGAVAGIFPEGNNNTIKDWGRIRRFFPGCARLAAMAGVPVVPASVAGLEEASPIFWARENEGEPITDLAAPPIILPLKVTVRFGEPVYVNVLDVSDRVALQRVTDGIQREVLRLFQLDRPKGYAVDSDGKRVS